MPTKHPGRRLKRVWVLLADGDIRALGREITAARPTVRFRADSSQLVHETVPEEARVIVHMADAELAPGYDLPEPDIRLGDSGVGIHLTLPLIVDDEMRAGSVSTLFRPDDPGHVAFVDAVFRAVQRVTKAHVLKMTGERANVRIGPEAEAWWRADDRRRLRDESTTFIYYKLADEVRPT